MSRFPLYQLSYRVIGAAGWYRTNILLRFKQALIYFSYSGNYLVPPHGIEPRPSALQAIVRTSYTREGINFGVGSQSRTGLKPVCNRLPHCPAHPTMFW